MNQRKLKVKLFTLKLLFAVFALSSFNQAFAESPGDAPPGCQWVGILITLSAMDGYVWHLECDDIDRVDLNSLPPIGPGVLPIIPPGGGGGGGGGTTAEQERKARCEQAKTDYSSNNCSSRDFNPPANDFTMRFTAQAQHAFFRPIVRDFHTQIFNGATSINNFSSVLTQLRGACDGNYTNIFNRNVCRNDADMYFDQQFGGGLQSFLDSPAGADAKPNVNGSACQAIRARHDADQCGAWPS